MKKIIISIIGIALMLFAFTACQPRYIFVPIPGGDNGGGSTTDSASTVFVSDGKDFKEAVEKDGDVIVILQDDITIDIAPWARPDNDKSLFGTDKTESIVIDGKGEHTITFNNTNSDWNAIYTKNENAVLTIKNATIDNSGHNADSGPWNSHDIIFNCNVVLDNVKSNNAIAVGKNATIKNSTITDSTCEQAAYMLWIQANGQTVTIENCKIEGKSTITNDNRAIKIADEYINEPKAVTLNVSDTTFSSDSKAAVLVTNTAGATINWGEENDISETVDTVNAVWIDSDRADYMDRVVVNGCKKVQE